MNRTNQLRSSPLILAALACSLGAPTPARAQCDPVWRALDPTAFYPGVDGTVNALKMWDQDGPGPITPKLVVAGNFSLIGNTLANNIALYDPVTESFSPLGAGVGDFAPGSGSVHALAVLPNNELVVGGTFIFAGGVQAFNIARWNGSAWSNLGTWLNGAVLAFTQYPNGDLVIGGDFTHVGGVLCNRVARWNGSVWSIFPTPTGVGLGDTVHALIVRTNSSGSSPQLYAGGAFWNNTGDPSYIARWSGSEWTSLREVGLTGLNTTVRAFALDQSNRIVVGGNFNTSIPTVGPQLNGITRWNPSPGAGTGAGNWVPFAPSPSVQIVVRAIAVMPSGEVVIAGDSFSGRDILRWSGTAWETIGTVEGDINAVAVLPNGDLVAGGDFFVADGRLMAGIGRWGAPAAPAVTDDPDFAELNLGEELTLSAGVSPGAIGVTVQWQRDGVNIADGAGGASPGGGTVSGASGALPSPTTAAPITLTIAGAQPGDSGEYTAIFTNGCGTVMTSANIVMVNTPPPPPCAGDANADRQVNFADITSILANWGSSGDPYLSGDASGDGVVTFVDITSALANWGSLCE